MKKIMFALIASALLANFAGISVSAADEKAPPVKDADKKTQPAKPAVTKPTTKPAAEKPDDKPLVIPDKIPTDPVENAKLAKAILEKASETVMKMKGFSCKTVQTSPKGDETITNITQRNNPDGTVFMRMDMIGQKEDKSDSMLFISNNDGYWYVIGNTAIKMTYLNKMQVDAMSNIGQIPKIGEDTQYSIKDGKINDIACFVVTGNISNEQLKILADLLLKTLPEDMKEMIKNEPVDITSGLPLVSKFFVGKKDYFTYSTEQYNKNGVKISQFTYTDVKLNIETGEELFCIPNDKEVKIANTITEYADFMINAFEKK
jgi:outer membrane lipoprotein-sorting protein